MKPISRRNFIKAGATTLTIPFLESFPQMSMAATASGSLKRILFFGLTNAQYEDVLMPTSTSYTTGPEGVRYIPLSTFSGDISQIFTAAKYGALKSKMNIMRGFDQLVNSSEIQPGHETLYPLGACGERSGLVKDTIDTVISNSSIFYPTAPFRKSLNAVPVNDQEFRYNYSWQGGSQRAVLTGPSSIFTDFFSGTLPSTGGTVPPPTDTNISRRIAMQNTVAKLNALVSSPKLSASDKIKLGAHASMVNDLLPNLAAPVAGAGSGGIVGPTCTKPTAPTGINESFLSASGNQARVRSCLDQIYMAFNCQLTNMAVFHPVVASDTGNWEMGDGGNDIYHQLAGHHYEVAKYLMYNGWVYDQLLYLLNKMDATKESNGLSMLDNSLVVVISNDACGVHSYEDIPVTTFGSLGGTIKTGNYINYQRTNAPAMTGGSLDFVPAPNANGDYTKKYTYNLGRPLGSLYNTILNALKIPHSGFGSYVDASGNYAAFTTAAAKQASLPLLV